MFDKLLAKVGIGSAKVDTVVKNMTLCQGDMVEGVVYIEGGKVEQEINKIEVSVMTVAKYESNDKTHHTNMPIGTLTMDFSVMLKPGEKHEIPFSFKLPSETPITTIGDGKNKCKVWVQTELDIESGLDSSDRDYLTITPHPAVSMMVNKFLENDFKFMKVDVEKGYLRTSTFASNSGIYQEIEMRPASAGVFNWSSRKVNEVELSFIVDETMVHLLVEVDRSFAGDGYNAVSYPINVQESEIEPYFRKVFP